MKQESNLGDRRPLATREKTWAKRLAIAIAERGFTPNSISIVGLVVGVLAGVAFVMTDIFPRGDRAFWLVGAVLVQCRLLSNMLDGMVAIESNHISPLGELFNEVPDRISDVCILIGIGYAADASPSLGYLAAVMAVLVAYMRAEGKIAGAEQCFVGPMAKPHRMFTVTLLALAQSFVPSDWRIIEFGESVISLPDLTLCVIIIGCLLTFVRRLKRVSEDLNRRRSI